MAKLIAPYLSTAPSGEIKVARYLEKHLASHSMVWHNIPITGSLDFRPDFIVLDPEHGLWVLEIKDWKFASVKKANADQWTVRNTTATSPLRQARNYCERLITHLEQEPLLVHAGNTRYAGRLLFPCAYGVWMSCIPREKEKTFESVLPPSQSLYRDDLKNEEGKGLLQKLLSMRKAAWKFSLSPPLVDHLRSILYPEIAIHHTTQGEKFTQAMDLQQEQLARELGNGHRIVQGVSGSGKTLILLATAQHLAQTGVENILILCFNKVLARWLGQQLIKNNLREPQAKAITFHTWLYNELKFHGLPIASSQTGDNLRKNLETFSIAVSDDRVKTRYPAILVDEAHDFEPDWLKLIASLLAPDGRLLLLVDKAQILYKRPSFTFSELGIQARGRTTFLRKNYRNAPQILSLAWKTVAPHLDISGKKISDEDTLTTLIPEPKSSFGRCLELAFIDYNTELSYVLDMMISEHNKMRPWEDMAILYYNKKPDDLLLKLLQNKNIPYRYLNEGHVDTDADQAQHNGSSAITLTTYHSSKGMEWPWVALLGLKAVTTAEEARLRYVAMTRATELLVLGHER